MCGQLLRWVYFFKLAVRRASIISCAPQQNPTSPSHHKDVLRDCVTLSPTCAAVLDERGHGPKLLMEAVVDGTLPCLEQLPWLTPYQAAFYNMQLLQGDSHVALGPFWARAGRCSASDVEQLNFFNAAKEAAQPSGQAPPFYTYGLSVTIGASEVFSYAVPPAKPGTYADLVVSSQKAFATGGVELLIAHTRDVDGFPTYVPDARTYRKFASPKMPLKVLVGTLDPQTPFGLGKWFVDGLGLEQDALVAVPWAVHGTVSEGIESAGVGAFRARRPCVPAQSCAQHVLERCIRGAPIGPWVPYFLGLRLCFTRRWPPCGGWLR
jgi:hypothetical protein